jgi:hypothetical protein
MNTNNTLEHAVIALKAGHKTEARGLLAQVIQQDPENTQAWLYLAAAVDTTAQRRTCLERVLALDPHHAVAQRALARLTVQSETQEGKELNPMSSLSDLAPLSVALPAATSPSPPTRKPLRVGGLAILALIFILVVVVGFAVSNTRQPKVAPLYAEPYVIIYGRADCGLTRAMAEDLFEAGIPYQFKSIDDPGVGDEIYPRIRAVGLDTSYFLLPVIDVNGHILLEAKVKDIARYYEQP